MAKLILFFVCVSSLFADPIEIEQAEDILPFVEPDSLVLFCDLSPNGPPIDAIIKELGLIGIHYMFPTPFYSESAARSPWEGGIMMMSDFNNKAKVFLKWIELFPFRPSQIVIIDCGNDPVGELP